ncbi:isoaspartyl peptidase/L-asparaginase family protein [Christiangramia forsetii]|uniref:Isoaspartyl peptidase n=2 Tax=Christiangramia forsetii TaxID=411153 RepID=A0LZC9_CHRFK|nr:isoaspartyl peptidase/L-asparaginase [Christiangramia forsetii]GGG38025.1 isoaspartyl peptidase/L-asparaginase [Christiangramia forsetii]CAL65724.1 L-asparaginase [Christiangramia forsetii KT0803]
MKANYSIAIHGGAGTLIKGKMTPDKEKEYRNILQLALDESFKILQNKGSAIEAVEKAVIIMEDSPLFNAGKGSVFTADGTHEMDAAIMEGKTRNAGAVSLITGIKNPISLAKMVMEKSPHVLLAGKGAMDFARLHGYELENEDYFYDEFRYQQWQELKDTTRFQLDHSQEKDSKFGTVGAVACDINGDVAAATSTGGMTNKNWGRIGDSPIIGVGNYANNNTCAVSCTGSGEYFMRGVVAYDVSCLMEYKNLSLKEAADEVIHHRLPKLKGDGGLIAIDARGNIAMPFNTEGMYRGKKTAYNDSYVAIYSN